MFLIYQTSSYKYYTTPVLSPYLSESILYYYLDYHGSCSQFIRLSYTEYSIRALAPSLSDQYLYYLH